MKERILSRIRRALQHRPKAAHPGAFTPPVPDSSSLERFAAHLEAAGGEVVRFASLEEAQAWLAEFARAFDGAAVSPLVPEALRPELPEVPPERAPLAVSLARAAVAETGTLLLDSREGRRLQLLAPVHLVWVRAHDVVDTLGVALKALEGELPAAVGLHSGPSKSADIGQIMVRGVHGPGRLIAGVLEAG
ncbi:LutC/YkgG family protein [Marinithermus hydrothermalis]|uniref:Lactate utilization protein B/C n=1 Tax=Marinithermus hydrothermalis (strain DSM 14884 / JCM 11576 / T1) TaxID=869210 RepID=F2NKK2_MARHT|nr:LUD domain-containing protein [Marinithermus hydrothermalis]AEB12662.1 Lactate utilization protein B/C [Marinithermus hydrothermalis DSM 14884]